MENGEKDSSPGPSTHHNLYDSAGFLGLTPYGLAAAAYGAHLSPFSLLQHHPAFPLFGGLGDAAAFAHLPTSLASSLVSSAGNATILNSVELGPLRTPLSITVPEFNKSGSETSLGSKSSPRNSPKTSKSSRGTKDVSPSSSSSSSRKEEFHSSHRKSSHPPLVSGSTGISLLSGKQKHSSRSNSTSLLSHMKSSSNGQLLSPSSSSASNAISSSYRLKDNDKHFENGNIYSGSENQSDASINSPSHSDDHMDGKLNGTPDHHGNNHHHEMDTNSEGDTEASTRNSNSPSVHIDGSKKKLIADQIRQRVQNKPIRHSKPSILQPIKRGRGRPPKQNSDPELTPQQLKVIQEYKKQQEELKRQLEASVRQQQEQMKMIKHNQEEKEKEAAIKVQKLLEASVKQARAHASNSISPRGPGRGRKPSVLTNMSYSSQSSEKPKPTILKQPSPRDRGAATSQVLNNSDDASATSLSYGRVKTFSENSEMSDGYNESINDSHISGESDEDDSDSDCDSPLKMVTDSDEGGSNEDDARNSKRSHDGSSASEAPTKKPRVQMDERVLRMPVDNGWKRQTTILAIGKRGFIGEVLYFAPCGKKLKTIPDVMRYLERNNVKDYGRENFSFNTKVNVGDFYEARHGQNGLTKLNQEEIRERMALVESKRQKMMRFRQQKRRKRIEKQSKQVQLAKQMMEQKLKKKLEQQEMARKAAEYKMQKKLEKDQQKELQNELKKVKALEAKKQREQMLLMKEQEKLKRQEQARLEREIRAQQILEERELKRQQAIMMKEQERERKRQHMILIKALEAQKKQAEKDRMREDRIAEKRIFRERKMEQKRWELQVARELKKPIEDMKIRNSKPFPELPRIPGVFVDSTAFADILMVLEFLHNFAEALGYDNETLPTLKALQDGIVGKTEEDAEDYISLVSHLLKYAVHDPGVPNQKEAMTRLGQKITDVNITESVVSEVLRIFVCARSGKDCEMAEWLIQHPLEALSHTQKASILAFLCNELLSGKTISGEIDKNMEKIGDLRRDKWMVEGKLRRLKTLQAKKFQKPAPPKPSDTGEDSMSNSMAATASKRGSDDEEDKDHESGNEYEGNSSIHEGEGEEEEQMSQEECEKQIDKLQKQHANYRVKVFNACQKLRCNTLGEDRFKRKYWILPQAGGLYVEGLESGIFYPDLEDKVKEEAEDDGEKAKVKEEEGGCVKKEVDESTGPSVKKESGFKSEDIEMKTEKDCKSSVVVPVPKDAADGKNTDQIEGEMIKVKMEITEDVLLSDVSVRDQSKDSESKLDQSLESSSMKWEKMDTEDISKDRKESHPAKSQQLGEDSKGDKDTTDSKKSTDDNDKDSCNDKINNKETLQKECNSSSKSESGSEISNKSSNSGESFNPFLQTITSPVCSSSSDSLKQSENINKDTCKSVVNGIPMTSSSPLITPYSSAPSLFFQPNFSSSLNGPLGAPLLPPHLPPTSSPIPAHQSLPRTSTPSGAEIKPSFLSIDTLLKKESSTKSQQQNNQFLQSPTFPVLSQVSPSDHLIHNINKDFSSSTTAQSSSSSTSATAAAVEQKPWFSILPRMPCDDLVMTSSQAEITNSPFASGSPFFSMMSGGYSLPSPSFSSFQLRNMYGSMSDLSCMSTPNSAMCSRTSSPQVDSSFKVPVIPKVESELSLQSMASEQVDPMEMLKEYQGDELPIPADLKKGWWRIKDVEQIKQVQIVCHSRGIREKELQKNLQKYVEYSEDNSIPLQGAVLESDESDEEEEEEEEEEENVEKEEDTEKEKKEEKTDKKGNKEKESAEIKKEKTKESKEDMTKDKKEEKSSKKEKKKKELFVPQKSWQPNVAFQVEMACLEEVESLIDKVANASLQVKGWKVPPRQEDDSDTVLVDRSKTELKSNEQYPLDVARGKLLYLEPNIERRYLKPPLCKARVQINLANISTEGKDQRSEGSRRGSIVEEDKDEHMEEEEEDEDVERTERPEDIPPGLQQWRTAVATSMTSAQLIMCVQQLNNSISWEKSIMKVLCQICRKDDNEAELLLCDGCDQGYHTYCFKPKMEIIPDGDWYCFECLSKATGVSCCLVCGKRMGKIAECHFCPRAIHLDCLDPPLPRMPRKWVCPSCSFMQQQGGGKRRSSGKKSPKKNDGGGGKVRERKDSTVSNKGSEAPPTPTPTSTEKKKSGGSSSKELAERKKQAETSGDMTVCRLILTEMEKHEDGWPFLKPVNFKQFPTYKKYIKQPMDFTTIRNKLRESQYKIRSDFAADSRLIFDNCKTFNEDDSEVGKCGHNLRKYFESRWKDLLLNSSNQPSSSSAAMVSENSQSSLDSSTSSQKDSRTPRKNAES